VVEDRADPAGRSTNGGDEAMPTTPVIHEQGSSERDIVVDEVRRGDGLGRAVQIVALVAAGIVTVLGIAALLSIDWSVATANGPAVGVAGLTFTPVVAAVTTMLGVLLIGAAVSDGDVRIALGGLVGAIGLAILLFAGSGSTGNQLSDGHGWLALAVGVVFVAAGVLAADHRLTQRWRSERIVTR
jgi:peptidoglycan/LPS O-acetylase OafA/YrhL